MLDLSHIPNNQENIKIFYSTGIANAWQTWQKPRKCQWVWIMAVGGGGGGANGSTTRDIQQSTGGASGAATRALFNATHLPDLLYVQVGLGGSATFAGNRSNVSIVSNTTSTNVILSSGNTAAAAGISNATANSAGETAMTATVAAFATLANFISTAGQTTFFGSPSVTPLTSQIVTAGGNGGYLDATGNVANGGNISSSSISPLI